GKAPLSRAPVRHYRNARRQVSVMETDCRHKAVLSEGRQAVAAHVSLTDRFCAGHRRSGPRNPDGRQGILLWRCGAAYHRNRACPEQCRSKCAALQDEKQFLESRSQLVSLKICPGAHLIREPFHTFRDALLTLRQHLADDVGNGCTMVERHDRIGYPAASHRIADRFGLKLQSVAGKGVRFDCAARQGQAVHDLAYKPLAAIRSERDRKSTRLNSSHVKISYAVFCLKKK